MTSPTSTTTSANGALDPVASAKAARLRYVSDAKPGIRRKRAGRHFSYVGPDGSTIRDPETLRRIKALGIPPAWTEVWISPLPNGHIQATGRDAKGRKQYRYHARWRETRDETKYGRLLAFGQALPALRARVAEDLARPGLPREKVLAAVVRLMEETLIRVGNDEYARGNESFGLTTMQDHHVEVSGAAVRFTFRGKSGKDHDVGLRDRRLAAIVKRCRDLPGQELFQYLDEAGEPRDVGSADVNAYLREVTGDDFSAKDVRTWAGTVHCSRELRAAGPTANEREAKHAIVEAVARVAVQLGNTPTICRKSYVHPAVIDAYLAGTLPELSEPDGEDEPPGLDDGERRLLGFLARLDAEAGASA